jgi:hypothetical protein
LKWRIHFRNRPRSSAAFLNRLLIQKQVEIKKRRAVGQPSGAWESFSGSESRRILAWHRKLSLLRPKSKAVFQWLDGAAGPRAEARGLFALVRGNAASIEATRDLIGISPRIETVLRFYMRMRPEDARGIEKVLNFRKRVWEEFDRLVGESERGDGRPPIEFHATRM